jgi:UDP-N-acetyl-2-amino-2-deoxyglucuronate dehydrogenase
MKHRVLLVGCGNIGKQYTDVVTELANIDITGVVGRDEQKTRLYAQKFGIKCFGTDIKEVAKESNATIALICTPNALHYQGVKEAAACGLHVLCEKPLHIYPEKQDEMIEICRRSNVKLGVCYRLRLLKHFRFIKDFIVSGHLGKVLVIDTYIKLWRGSDYYSNSSWHGKPDIDGGGPFIQQGSHYIDLAVWFGSGFKRVVSSDLFTLLHPIEVEDHGYAVVEYSNGAKGLIQASTICKGNQVFNSRIEISGTKGSIIVGNEGILEWDVEGFDKPEIEYTGDVFDELFMDFTDAVENSREPFINGEAAKASVELINEIYRKGKR